MSLLVPLENLVKRDHPYRMILSRIDFAPLVDPLHGCIKEVNSKYSVSQGFRMLLLQSKDCCKKAKKFFPIYSKFDSIGFQIIYRNEGFKLWKCLI